MSSWLRLFPCTQDKMTNEDLKKLATTLDIGSHINARLQLLPEARANTRVSCQPSAARPR